MLHSIVKFILIAVSVRCICGIQNGGYVVLKGKKEKQLNLTGSSISSPRNRIECAEWCLRNHWCVAATYIKNGGPNEMKCFMSAIRGGCLEEDTDAVFIKRNEIIQSGFKDCKELMEAGFSNDGSYKIAPDGAAEIDVVCDLTTSGGGWTVIQQRRDGTTDFFRDWVDYENGFGNRTPCGNYWIGLETIRELSSTSTTELYVELTTSDGQTKHAQYSSFSLDDASEKYALHLSGYSGDAGDSLIKEHNGMPFSTFDRDDNIPAGCGKSLCAANRHGAWWYNCCYWSNLNGEYLNSTVMDTWAGQHGMKWMDDFGSSCSMMHTTMMIRRAR